MQKIRIHDKVFKILIKENEIQKSIDNIASKMDKNLRGKDVIFLSILNGSFVFASDLLKRITFPCQISFVKMARYQGISAVKETKQLIGINENLKNKTVVILEDIIDSGTTIDETLKLIEEYKPLEIQIASLLFKPDAFQSEFKIDYYGFSIPNNFVIGCGLDYNGYGRNYPDIYSL
ncbi:phosphoribosyltransferase [Bacteroidota bacterium]